MDHCLTILMAFSLKILDSFLFFSGQIDMQFWFGTHDNMVSQMKSCKQELFLSVA